MLDTIDLSDGDKDFNNSGCFINFQRKDAGCKNWTIKANFQLSKKLALENGFLVRYP